IQCLYYHLSICPSPRNCGSDNSQSHTYRKPYTHRQATESNVSRALRATYTRAREREDRPRCQRTGNRCAETSSHCRPRDSIPPFGIEDLPTLSLRPRIHSLEAAVPKSVEALPPKIRACQSNR